MQVTQQTDYALRILMFVAINSDRLVNISEIATTYKISQSHLTKIVANLTKYQYLMGKRGKGGGIYLAKSPEEINIGAIMRQFEPFNLVECQGTNCACIIAPNCQLNAIFDEAREAFIAVFDQYFLRDIIQNQSLINQIKKM